MHSLHIELGMDLDKGRATYAGVENEEHHEHHGEEEGEGVEEEEEETQEEQEEVRDHTNPEGEGADASNESAQKRPTSGPKQPDLMRSFTHQVDKCIEHMSRLLDMNTTNEWESFLKHKQFKKTHHTLKVPMKPGIFFIAVSPVGTAYVRRSGNLSSNDIFKKYSDDLLWALKFMMNDQIRDTDKDDIGGHHSGPPPEFELKEMTANQKASRGKADKPQYSDQLKITVRELVKELRHKHRPHAKSQFCPKDKRHVCSEGHEDGICAELRAAFNWPSNVPCVEPGHMTKEQLHSVLLHYASEFPNITIPTQPPKGR